MELISLPNFADEPFISAEEKRCILRAWLRFLRNGCAWNDFTIALYTHLTLHCSFIAHYNRRGFYEYYFSNPGQQTFRFFDQFDPVQPGISAEIGMIYWLNGPTASDLNRVMRDAAAPYLSKLRERFRVEIKQTDLAQAAALAKAHGFALIEDNGGRLPWRAPLSRELANGEEPGDQQTLFPK